MWKWDGRITGSVFTPFSFGFSLFLSLSLHSVSWKLHFPIQSLFLSLPILALPAWASRNGPSFHFPWNAICEYPFLLYCNLLRPFVAVDAFCSWEDLYFSQVGDDVHVFMYSTCDTQGILICAFGRDLGFSLFLFLSIPGLFFCPFLFLGV